LRAYLLVTLLLFAIFGSIAGFLYNKFSTLAGRDFTPPPVVIAADVARESVWRTTLDAVGTLRAVRGAELAAETSGEIIAIAVSSGQQVEKGQLLLTLNDSVEQASKRRQEANLELARLLFERDASLIKQKSIPQSQYDRSRADLESAIAQLAEIEARLDNKRIVAPFTGTLGIIRVKEGDYIASGTAITTLQDLSELEIDFSVPAHHAPRMRSGLSIEVFSTSFPQRSFAAVLQALDSRVDAGTRNLSLRARLLESQGLLPGMFVRLRIDLDLPRQLVSVPETAISYSLQGDTVWVVREEEQDLLAEPRVVRTGPARDGQIAITSGIAAGERVVIAGQNKLSRGARVTIDDSVAM
jgi:membrane fusion protein (multidrug efflux system)